MDYNSEDDLPMNDIRKEPRQVRDVRDILNFDDVELKADNGSAVIRVDPTIFPAPPSYTPVVSGINKRKLDGIAGHRDKKLPPIPVQVEQLPVPAPRKSAVINIWKKVARVSTSCFR